MKESKTLLSLVAIISILASCKKPAETDDPSKRPVIEPTEFSINGTWYLTYQDSYSYMHDGKFVTCLAQLYTFGEKAVLTMDNSSALDSFRADYGSFEADYNMHEGTFLSPYCEPVLLKT